MIGNVLKEKGEEETWLRKLEEVRNKGMGGERKKNGERSVEQQCEERLNEDKT